MTLSLTPVLPSSPAPSAPVPQWCVQRLPSVGSDAVILVGFDGEGYPICECRVKVWANMALWEKVIERELETERAKRESRSPRFTTTSPLRLLP